ncbi:MAG: prolipoprotein diacylglyceryl transferase [Bacteriovoracaceae bacterium]
MNTTQWFDPVLFSLGPLEIRWYGLMYVLGFLVGGQILKYLATEKFWPVAKEEIDKYVTWLIVGMFLGARLAYVFIYNWDYYSDNFMDIFAVWKGGLSFHGAVAGMCLATWIFAKKHELHFFQIADCMAVAGSPGLFFGRMGNFINGELYGRVTDSWAGMVFPGGGPFPRHPSQLYEGISEGLILFVILFWIHRRQKFYGVVSSVFLLGYGFFRFTAEFFREPDSQLGYYFEYFTMGQILCFMMMAVSFGILKYAKFKNIKNPLQSK